jgi:hypothetical protein
MSRLAYSAVCVGDPAQYKRGNMPKIELPFIGGAYTARDKNLNAQVCQNLYVEMDQTGAKNILALVNTPGLVTWCDCGEAAEVRALHVFGDYLYVIIGNKLFKIDSSAGYTLLGTLTNSTGAAFMKDNSVDLLIQDGLDGHYVWDGVTLTSIVPSQAFELLLDQSFITTGLVTVENAWHDPTHRWAASSDATAYSHTGAESQTIYHKTLQSEINYDIEIDVSAFTPGATLEVGFSRKTGGDALDKRDYKTLTPAVGTLTCTLTAVGNSRPRFYMEADGAITITKVSIIADSSNVVLDYDASWMDFQDGYWFLGLDGSDQFRKSGQDDPIDWDPTEVAFAEGDSDKTLRGYSANRLLWLLGERTTEIFYNNDGAFERYAGGFLSIGCGAARSVDDMEGVIFWLDNKHRIVRSDGIGYTPVSTYQIDYQISKLTKKDDATAYCYTQEGHSFYVITFPTDRVTFAYDITTGFWHTRASGTNDDRERGNCHVRFAEKELIGDFENGLIYYMDLGAYTDNGTTKRAIRAAQAVHKKRQNIRHTYLELEMETGTVESVGPDYNPQIMMQYSDDNGATWSSELWESMGLIGQKGIVVRWSKLGISMDRIYRVIIAYAVRREITNAYLWGS